MPLSSAPVLLPAFGLTEDNADLLWDPASAAGRGGPAFAPARAALSALHPTYIRLLIDWAVLQPRSDTPAALEGVVDGCARGVAPCGPFAGVRDELAAIASQQRAAGPAGGGFQVVLDIFGAPRWAARGPFGCEAPGTTAFARPLRPDALLGYRGLIRSLLQLGARAGVALAWWSPWNEPNDPRFISPQRPSCSASARALAPQIYGQLATAMAGELKAAGGVHRLVLGELNDLARDSPRTTSVASFVAALPSDVLCLDGIWSIHIYAEHHGGAPGDGVSELEAALARRGTCAANAPIWVTEAGAGAPHAGTPRTAGAADELAGCRALAAQLLRWHADPRVGAVFQYSFREDPAFPVGLLSAELSHVYPSYHLWLHWSRWHATGGPPPQEASACA